MKLGAENRTKLVVAIVLMIAAAACLWVFLVPGTASGPASAANSSGTSAAQAVAAAPHGRILAKGGKKGTEPPRSLDPTLRYDWLKASEDTKYEGNGRNIFRAEVEIPKPIVSPVKQSEEVNSTPPPPPPPPPINLKFFGFASHPGEPKKIFLSQGEDIFVAREGDIVDRRYRIVHIMPNAVEVEDVLNNNRQSIPLTQG